MNYCYNENVVYSKIKNLLKNFFNIIKKMQQDFYSIDNVWKKYWIGSLYPLLEKKEKEVLNNFWINREIKELDKVKKRKILTFNFKVLFCFCSNALLVETTFRD